MHRKLTSVIGGFVALALTSSVIAVPSHTVSINVDGRDELRIVSNSLTVDHFTWGLPSALVVDSVAQPLTWNGNTSVPFATPLTGDYWIKKTLGRDGGYAVQRSNGFVLAAADSPNGADTYEFQFFPTPQANTIEWMRVVGAGATPGLMSFPATPGYVAQPIGTETTFSLNVDGTDELLFVNGSLVIRHLSWGNPVSLTVNNVPQTLTFTNNLSNPIPLALPAGFQFTQLTGRSALYPVQTPVGLVIGAADELVGNDTYTWKLTAVPEPTGLIAVTGIAMLATRRRKH